MVASLRPATPTLPVARFFGTSLNATYCFLRFRASGTDSSLIRGHRLTAARALTEDHDAIQYSLVTASTPGCRRAQEAVARRGIADEVAAASSPRRGMTDDATPQAAAVAEVGTNSVDSPFIAASRPRHGRRRIAASLGLLVAIGSVSGGMIAGSSAPSAAPATQTVTAPTRPVRPRSAATPREPELDSDATTPAASLPSVEPSAETAEPEVSEEPVQQAEVSRRRSLRPSPHSRWTPPSPRASSPRPRLTRPWPRPLR